MGIWIWVLVVLSGLFAPADNKLLEKSDLHAVLADKLQAEKYDMQSRHETRYVTHLFVSSCLLCAL